MLSLTIELAAVATFAAIDTSSGRRLATGRTSLLATQITSGAANRPRPCCRSCYRT